MSLCLPDVSPLPHKGLIICTSRSWETPLEKTRGTYSDRVRPIVLIFLSCIRSQRLQLLHWDTCFFSHISSGCEKKKKEPQRRLRGREAARAAYTCCATDLQRRGESLEDRGDMAHGSEPLPGRHPHLHTHTGTRLRLIPGKSRTVYHSQYRSFTLWPDKMIFFFSCSGGFFLPLGSVSVRHAVTVWAQSVSDLVPDLLSHLKKKNKKREEKKRKSISVGTNMKSALSPPDDGAAGLFPHKRPMFTFGNPWHGGKRDVVVKFN